MKNLILNFNYLGYFAKFLDFIRNLNFVKIFIKNSIIDHFNYELAGFLKNLLNSINIIY